MSLPKYTILVITVSLLVASTLSGANSQGTRIVFYDPIEVQPYISYLKDNAKPPLEYVMELFETYDLVILSERTHPETTQWEFIYELTSNPRFIEGVGHIFTEYGSVLQQPSLEKLMNTSSLGEREVVKQVIAILRNFPTHPYGWNNNNFFDYLKELYRLNQSLAVHKKIRLYFSGVPWQWEGKTKEDYNSFWKTEMPNRDKIMANRIISRFHEILESDSRRKKALVIMNTRHAYRTGGSFNTGDFIFREFPKKTANVMFNTTALYFSDVSGGYDQSTGDVPIHDGRWDTAFWRLGSTPLGFDFKHSPFGKDQFDLHAGFAHIGLEYEDVFTGMIFYQPLDKHMVASNIPGYYDEEFKQTVLERAQLKGDEDHNRLAKMFRNIETNPNAWNKRKQYWHDKTDKEWWCRLEFKVGPDPLKSKTPLRDIQAHSETPQAVKRDLAPGGILPTAREIMERNIRQIGGQEALAKVKNRLIRGATKIGQLRGVTTIYHARPNKCYTSTKFEINSATISIEQGTNGQVAWEIHSMTGPRIMEGQEKALMLLQSNFDETNYQQLHNKIECVGVEQIEGEICYKVIQTPKQAVPITAYYSKESGLAVKSTYTLEQQSEKTKIENLLSNYREVGGILYPYHAVYKDMNIDVHIIVESIEHNVEMPEDRFDVPEAVKKILRRTKEKVSKEAVVGAKHEDTGKLRRIVDLVNVAFRHASASNGYEASYLQEAYELYLKHYGREAE